jgi:hypothetical protein
MNYDPSDHILTARQTVGAWLACLVIAGCCLGALSARNESAAGDAATNAAAAPGLTRPCPVPAANCPGSRPRGDGKPLPVVAQGETEASRAPRRRAPAADRGGLARGPAEYGRRPHHHGLRRIEHARALLAKRDSSMIIAHSAPPLPWSIIKGFLRGPYYPVAAMS